LYDDIQGTWVREEIDLSPWSGQEVMLRFNLRSDANTNADGFFFDDMSITIIDITTETPVPETEETYSLSVPRPNPVSSHCIISYKQTDDSGILLLTDGRGVVLLEIVLKEKTG